MRSLFVLLLAGLALLLACESAAVTTVPIPRPEARSVDRIDTADLPRGLSMHPLLFSDTIEAMVNDGRMRQQASLHRRLQIGRYTDVKRHPEVELLWGLDSADESQLRKLSSYRPVDARDYILDQAEDHRVLIISEAHTKPEHRVFTRRLLSGLYDRGYRHLGLENILPRPMDSIGTVFDTNLLDRGYPLLSLYSGVYAGEFNYGNLIREAIRIGFKVFAYERNGSSDSERDRQQAEHLVAYQRRHPGEKIICHGGWYHAIEGPQSKYGRDESYYLAYHYKQMTGDDPLTVYQDALNEKIADNQRNSPYYDRFLADWGDRVGDYPVVPVGPEGEAWRPSAAIALFDVMTLQPPVTYRDGLPNWLANSQTITTEDGLRVETGYAPSPAFFDKLLFPVLISVRGLGESEWATPLFAREVTSPTELSRIPLPPGSYVLEMRPAQGEVFLREIIVAK